MANRRPRPWKAYTDEPGQVRRSVGTFATRPAAFKRARRTALFEHITVYVRNEHEQTRRWVFTPRGEMWQEIWVLDVTRRVAEAGAWERLDA